MDNFSSHGSSFLLWYVVIGNRCYIFSTIFSFALLQSSCYNLYVFLTLFCWTYNVTELYPILIHCRSIFSHCIKSYQYPQAQKLTAGVIIRPRRNNYLRWRPCKKNQFEKNFSQKSHSAENRLTAPNTILIHCQKHTLP